AVDTHPQEGGELDQLQRRECERQEVDLEPALVVLAEPVPWPLRYMQRGGEPGFRPDHVQNLDLRRFSSCSFIHRTLPSCPVQSASPDVKRPETPIMMRHRYTGDQKCGCNARETTAVSDRQGPAEQADPRQALRPLIERGEGESATATMLRLMWL